MSIIIITPGPHNRTITISHGETDLAAVAFALRLAADEIDPTPVVAQSATS